MRVIALATTYPPEQLTEADLVLPNLEGVRPESIEPLISANRPAEPSLPRPPSVARPPSKDE